LIWSSAPSIQGRSRYLSAGTAVARESTTAVDPIRSGDFKVQTRSQALEHAPTFGKLRYLKRVKPPWLLTAVALTIADDQGAVQGLA